jgi:hypothetical protein
VFGQTCCIGIDCAYNLQRLFLFNGAAEALTWCAHGWVLVLSAGDVAVILASAWLECKCAIALQAGGKFQLLLKVCYVSGQQSSGELIARATV